MKALKRAAEFWRLLDFDRLDFLTLAGLVMVHRGLSLVSEAAAWATCGGVLLLFVLIGALRRGG